MAYDGITMADNAKLLRDIALLLAALVVIGGISVAESYGLTIDQFMDYLWISVGGSLLAGAVAGWQFSYLNKIAGIMAGFGVAIATMFASWEIWDATGWWFWLSVLLAGLAMLAVLNGGTVLIALMIDRIKHRNEKRTGSTNSSTSAAKKERARRMKERIDRRTQQEQYLERQAERRNREQSRRVRSREN